MVKEVLTVDENEMLNTVKSAILNQNTEMPFITLSFAQSLDGSISAGSGETLQLSNGSSMKLTHQIREIHDGILIGINTQLTDDPRLTVRLSEGKSPQPVVLDSYLRFPLSANLLKAPCVPPIIVTSPLADKEKAKDLTAAGAEIITVPLKKTNQLDLAVLFPLLKQKGINSIMVEGGGEVISSMINEKWANHLLLTISPMFIGGIPCYNNCDSPNNGMKHLKNITSNSLNGDVIISGSFDWNNSDNAK